MKQPTTQAGRDLLAGLCTCGSGKHRPSWAWCRLHGFAIERAILEVEHEAQATQDGSNVLDWAEANAVSDVS